MLKTSGKCQFCNRPLDAQGFCTQYQDLAARNAAVAAQAKKQQQKGAR